MPSAQPARPANLLARSVGVSKLIHTLSKCCVVHTKVCRKFKEQVMVLIDCHLLNVDILNWMLAFCPPCCQLLEYDFYGLIDLMEVLALRAASEIVNLWNECFNFFANVFLDDRVSNPGISRILE
jgi:hypothetical protein